MEAILITAVLRNGFVTRSPLAPAIEGIIAYRHLYERMGPDAFNASRAAGEAATIEDLPLETMRDGDTFWYSASLPIFISAGEDIRYFHRRFDDHIGQDRLVEKQKRVLTTGGTYKGARRVDKRTVTSAIQWHVVGDRDEIERLLGKVLQIGGGRGRGYGEVVEWRFDIGDSIIAREHRALPVPYAERNDIEGRLMQAAIRPPAWLPENQCLCIVPDSERRI